MSTKDYLGDNLSIESFIPETLRTKTVSSIVSNLFDRHLTKDESKAFYGYVGKKQTDPNDFTPFVKHSNQERRINNLHPLIQGSVGTETHVFSFNDVLNRCKQLGIDTDKFHKWGQRTSFNLAPPIDLDKFVNYKRYRWAPELFNITSIPGNSALAPEFYVIKRNKSVLKDDVVGIITDASILTSFNISSAYNIQNASGVIYSDYLTIGSRVFIMNGDQYDGIYVVGQTSLTRADDFSFASDLQRGAIINLTTGGSILITPALTANYNLPLAITGDTSPAYVTPLNVTILSETDSVIGNVPAVNDWAKFNCWIHEDDLKALGVDKALLKQGVRPIIEFADTIELAQKDVFPNVRNTQRKTSWNQAPLFNHYHFSASRSKQDSLFRYGIDASASIDQFLNLRIAREKNTQDFVFEQTLIEDTGATLFYKNNDVSVIFDGTAQIQNSETLESIWQSGPMTTSFIIANQQSFSGTAANVTINSIGERESNDTIIFKATSAESVSFESKTLGHYAGPIIRTNVNPAARTLKVVKNSITAEIQVDDLQTYLDDGYVELMSDVYVGETVEIPGYVKFTFTGDTVAPTINDEHITKIFVSEVPRYVTYNADDNLVDFYQGEAADIQIANDNNIAQAGAWLTPNPLKQNILHENRTQFAFGDLSGHFRLIMAEQPGITGSLNGSNNFRQLTSVNFGLGGIIKNYDNGFNMLISMMLQDDITPLTIIDFIESQYNQNLLSISEFLKKELSSLFTEIGVAELQAIDSSNPYVAKLYDKYAAFMSARQDIAAFEDTTMPIPKWIMTLPAARITPSVKPVLQYANDVGMMVMVHHDGHQTGLTSADLEFNRNLAQLQVNPKNAADISAGFIDSSLTPPTTKAWFKGMCWFNPTTNVLRVLNVVGDSATIAAGTYNIGDFWLVSGELYQYDGTYWNQFTGPSISAWVEVKPELIFDSLIMFIEEKIYNSLPVNGSVLSQPTSMPQEQYEEELVRFAAKYNYDVYSPDYSASNAWTWNYSLADFSSVSPSLNGTARWIKLYEKYLGTSRPVYEPWKLLGISDTASVTAFINQWASSFYDASTRTITPLSLNDYHDTVVAVAAEEINVSITIAGGHCPSIVDGVTLSPGVKVLVTAQTNTTQNGIYTVSSVGSGSNGVWTKVSSLTSSSDGQWIFVSGGDIFGSSKWVVKSAQPSGSYVSIVFEQYRFWKKAMWDMLSSVTSKKICVNPYTDSMIPPYVSYTRPESAYALLTTIPAGISSGYKYGDFGPIELLWTKSVEFKSAVARVEFKNDPINFLMKTWGTPVTTHALTNSENRFERNTVVKQSHTDIVLHGETIVPVEREVNRVTPNVITGLRVLPEIAVDSYNVTLECVDYKIEPNGFRTTPIFRVRVNGQDDNIFIHTVPDATYSMLALFVEHDGTESDFIDTTFGIVPHDFKIAEHGHGYNIGDVLGFTVKKTGIDQNTVTITPTNVCKVIGFNQSYTHLMRFNNYDTVNSFNNTFLRKWDVRFGYRFDSIVKTDEVKIKSETFDIPSSLRDIQLKVNPHVREFWIHALRVQVVRIGQYTTSVQTTTTTADGNYVTGVTGIIPAGYASDWEFRIENYNARDPFIDVVTYDTTEVNPASPGYETFTPLGNSNFKTWKKYTKITGTETVALPRVITGLQNLVNVLFGYIDHLEMDGWQFNLGNESNIDAETNRTITWQLEVEKLIGYIYTGISEGQGHILNPFKTSVWFDSPTGLISKFEDKKFVDFHSSQVACDVFGNVIPVDNLRVLRNESLTEIASEIPMFSMHLFVDEYEHVVLFNDYVDETNKFTLIFDPYLGLSVARLLFNGQQHSIKTGRPVLGGYYLKGNSMAKNMMKQVDEVADYYDVTTVLKSPEIAKNSLAVVGFNKKGYFDQLSISDTSQFNFWQAMIKSKGTNQNIDAYLNNNRFKTASLDEYWAYKVATYGDARTQESPDLNVGVSDFDSSYATFQFNGLDDLAAHSDAGRIINIDQLSDDRWSYTNRFDQDFISYFLVRRDTGEWTIDANKLASLTAEQRTEFEKILNKHFYFAAARLATIENLHDEIRTGRIKLTKTLIDELGSETDSNNVIVTFELPKAAWTADKIVVKFYECIDSSNMFFKEIQNPPVILERLNDKIVKFKNIALSTVEHFVTHDPIADVIGNTTSLMFDINGAKVAKIIVEFYGVDIASHNGTKLLDYDKQTLVDDIPLWHPAMGSVNAQGRVNLDFETSLNPAKYSYVPSQYRNALYSNINPWGAERVGSIWWNTENLAYTPYYDVVRTPLVQDRISRWGKLADFSSIDVYEWVESSVPPTEYDAKAALEEGNFAIDASVRTTGRAALSQTFSRNRIWYTRPVAWAHVSTPIKSLDDVNSGLYYLNDTRMFLSSTQMGNIWVTLDNVPTDATIAEGTQVVGWGNKFFDVDAENKPVGQLVFTDSVDYVVGRQLTENEISTSNYSTAFTAIYSRAVERDALLSTDPARLSNIVSSATVTKLDPSKNINVLGKISFKLDGFVWDARYINTLEANGGIPVTNVRAGINEGNLQLSLIQQDADGDIVKETISVQARYECSKSRPIVFEFPLMNVKVTMAIDQSSINYILNQELAVPGTPLPSSIEQIFSAHSFVHLFGGKASIFNFADLDSAAASNIDSYLDFAGEFTSANVFVRRQISATVISAFSSAVLSNVMRESSLTAAMVLDLYPNLDLATYLGLSDASMITDTTLINVPEYQVGWRSFTTPSQSDITNDAPYPLNLWIPLVGTALCVSQPEQKIIDSFGLTATQYNTDASIVDLGVSYINNAVFDKSGTNMAPFKTLWGNWIPLFDKTFTVTVVKSGLFSLDFAITDEANPIISNVKLYVNGQIQPQTTYSLINGVVTYTNGSEIPVGTEFVVIYSKYEPTADELAFNPDVAEDITRQVHFKNDYPYTKEPVRDATGAISSFKYYFWVKNKTIASSRKTAAVDQIKSLLENKPTAYMTMQNILDEKNYSTTLPVDGINFTLPIRYQTITVNGLDLYVRRNNAYKIRFVKNLTLRNDPDGLNLKNVHTEWTLIRPNMTNRKIPQQLWDKLVDSACGQDITGHQIPSFERIDYDSRHLTQTRYGFNYDQILCDSETLIKTIKYIIQNTKIVKMDKDGNTVADSIDFLDFSIIDSYFVSVDKIRETMTLIWNKAKKRQINEIFFACLEDIIALNYEMTDLFKTSKLSVHSLRTINEIQKTGIVYDN